MYQPIKLLYIMKPKIYLIIILLVAVLGMRFSFRKYTASPMLLENVEALAAGEIGKPYTCAGMSTLDCPGSSVKVQAIYLDIVLKNMTNILLLSFVMMIHYFLINQNI